MLKAIFGNPLTKGTQAPDFDLLDQHGQCHKLSGYLGKWMVVYFYPKDHTMGCTREACSFRDDFEWFNKRNIPVFGISTDTVESHKSFAEAQKLPFLVLADPEGKTCRDYGVMSFLGLAHRVTFLINPVGKIADTVEWAHWSKYADAVKKRLLALPDFDGRL